VILRVAFLTLGCKVNFYETERMKRQFEEAGYLVVAFSERADVYIINTCTVTNIADRKSRQMLHRARRNNPDAVVAAVGCYVDSAKEDAKTDAGIDVWIPNKEKGNFIAKIEAVLAKRQTENALWGKEEVGMDAFEKNRHMTREAAAQEHTRAFLKVQDGCNQYCTYCIIPYVRGALKSRGEQEAADEVKRLADRGIREVVVTGIHLSSYGLDFTGKKSFLDLSGRPLLSLLGNIAGINGIERIRLGSLEPRVITEEFAEALSKIPKICPHFHLSLQSGSDGVLRRMNRHYTGEEYLGKLEILRKFFVYPAITTDLIVGFPNETEEEFQETCALARKAGFSQIHVFKYSRRRGTMADAMAGQLSEQEKSVRSSQLTAIGKELEMQYRKAFAGQTEKVLLEEMVSVQGKPYLAGYNERYVRIAIKADMPDAKQLCNTVASVRISGELADGMLLGICGLD